MDGETPGPSPEEIQPANLVTAEQLDKGYPKPEQQNGREKDDETNEKREDKEKGRIELENLRENQSREDSENISQIRSNLRNEIAPKEQEDDIPNRGGINGMGSRANFQHFLKDTGIEISDRHPTSRIEEMGNMVINGLDKEFPQFNLKDRLDGEEQRTILGTNTTMNEFAYRRQGLPDWIRAVAKYIPYQANGLHFRDRGTVINGSLPNFLIERSMYHEYTHAASAHKFNRFLNEGATEYYSRQAASKNGLLQNIVNSEYLPGFFSYALMKGAVGSEIADQAYFNGQIKDFISSLDQKWGEGSYAKINGWSHNFFGLRGFAYAVYKSVTRRGRK